MKRRLLQIAGALAAAPLIACLPDAPRADVGLEAGAVVDRYAVVALEAERAVGLDEVQLAVRAHFVEASELRAADVLAAFDLAPLDERCGFVDDVATPRGSRARVSLLDVGRLHVTGNGGTVEIVPQSVPDQLEQLAGVVYGVDDAAEGPRSPRYKAGEPFLVWAEGAASRGFTVGLRAPESVAIVAVNGLEPGSAAALDVDFDDGLFVEFLTGADTVELELRAGLAPNDIRFRCTQPADAPIVIDADVLDTLRGAGEPLALQLRTLSRAALPEEAGIPGEARFAFVDALDLVDVPLPR